MLMNIQLKKGQSEAIFTIRCDPVWYDVRSNDEGLMNFNKIGKNP